jgi:hypothetical protein
MVKHLAFADHYPFSRRDILEIYRQAASMNLRNVVCTAKDAVKIKPLLGQDTALRWWRLDTEVAFDRSFDHLGDGHENFANWLSNWWETSASAASLKHVHRVQVQANPQRHRNHTFLTI